MLVAVHYLQCMMSEIYPLWKRFYDSVFYLFCKYFVSQEFPVHIHNIWVVYILRTVKLESCLTKSDVIVLEMSLKFFGRTKIFFLKPRDKVCHHENWFCGQISQEIRLTVSFQLQFFVYLNFVFGKLNFKTKIFLIL